MSKLPIKHQFLDLSDYGRPIANRIAHALKNTSFTPIDVTIGFVISGLLAIVCMLLEQYWLAALFLILKSILDAADGELARIKKTPSYTGRYLDSVCDILLNFLILTTILIITESSGSAMVLSFLAIQLQGTLYNYYSVILRNRFNGDTTSRIFEHSVPKAMKGEKQKNVNILFKLYILFYGLFDKTIYYLDKNAVHGSKFPGWFMTVVSIFGLGFQLLVIALLLVSHLENYIFTYFIGSSFLLIFFILIRKFINRKRYLNEGN